MDVEDGKGHQSQVLGMHIPQLTYFKRMHTLLILGKLLEIPRARICSYSFSKLLGKEVQV